MQAARYCGNNNFDGIPAIAGGIVSAIVAGVANDSMTIESYHSKHSDQATTQFVDVVVTLVFSAISGIVTAYFLKGLSMHDSDESKRFHSWQFW